MTSESLGSRSSLNSSSINQSSSGYLKISENKAFMHSKRQSSLNKNSSGSLKLSRSQSNNKSINSNNQNKLSGSISRSSERNSSFINDNENKHITRDSGKMIDHYYEKYTKNLKQILIENKKDIDLIGNERFKGHDASYLLDEMNNHNIKNKFNEEYLQEAEEMAEIDKILNNPDCELTKEQREYLIRKRQSFEENIELTPLPIVHRKSLENADANKIEILNKAQRSAVIMRRYEYEMNMKKNKNKKKTIKSNYSIKHKI